jgi:hypothetical protein
MGRLPAHAAGPECPHTKPRSHKVRKACHCERSAAICGARRVGSQPTRESSPPRATRKSHLAQRRSDAEWVAWAVPTGSFLRMQTNGNGLTQSHKGRESMSLRAQCGNLPVDATLFPDNYIIEDVTPPPHPPASTPLNILYQLWAGLGARSTLRQKDTKPLTNTRSGNVQFHLRQHTRNVTRCPASHAMYSARGLRQIKA